MDCGAGGAIWLVGSGGATNYKHTDTKSFWGADARKADV